MFFLSDYGIHMLVMPSKECEETWVRETITKRFGYPLQREGGTLGEFVYGEVYHAHVLHPDGQKTERDERTEKHMGEARTRNPFLVRVGEVLSQEHDLLPHHDLLCPPQAKII